MINSQSSRRNFLGSLAILFAGSAFGSLTRLVPETPAPDLYRAWKQFCRQNGGQLCRLALPDAATLAPCKGHWYETGEVIAFPQYNLLAQPTWVYWSEEKTKPADIIITLYKNDAAKTKLARLNRFEWEGLQSLPVDSEPLDVVALMKEACRPHASAKKKNASVSLKVVVRKGRNINISARLKQQEVSINKQFLYSI
jgi:hypothetical protein